MTRRDCLAAYNNFSGQASANVRTLGLAAIAVIWVFKRKSADGGVHLPLLLIWSGTVVVLALAFDFLHYITGTVAWGWFNRQLENDGVSLDQQFQAPAWLNWPINACFILKTALLAIGYLLLLVSLFSTLATIPQR